MESAPDRGSIFRIRLPRPRLEALVAAAPPGRAANEVNHEQRAQKYILVVDDEPDVRAYLRSALEDAGFTVETAADGQEALETGEAPSPDLISLDLVMPSIRVSGFTGSCKKTETSQAFPS